MTPDIANVEERMTKDEVAIRALIAAQFEGIRWSPESSADWRTVHRGFAPGAQLWPARRPPVPQSALDFTSRLRRLREEGLNRFTETGVGCHVWIVGNMAVALAGCEMVEGDSGVTRDISGYLLVKHDDEWRIAAQAWDLVDDIEAAFAAAGLPSGG